MADPVFIAVRNAAAIVRFREKDVTLALGITGHAVFSAEAALALQLGVSRIAVASLKNQICTDTGLIQTKSASAPPAGS